MSIKFLTILAILSIGSQSFAETWKCDGICRMQFCAGDDNPSEGQYYNIRGSGRSQSEARTITRDKCRRRPNNTYDLQCRAVGTVFPSDCREFTPPASNYIISIKNTCRNHGQIFAAIHYKNLQNQWDTAGFWKIAYGETAKVALTQNRNFYVHGHTANGVVWGDGTGSWSLYGKTYKFSLATIPQGKPYGPIEHTMSCN